MRRILQSVLIFLAGLFGGLLIAQCMIVLAARQGGTFGGEVFTVAALPMLIAFGYCMGHDHRRMRDYEKGHLRGYRFGYCRGFEEATKKEGLE